MPTTTARSLLAAGSDALARGAWRDSRDLFLQAIERAETAEAQEGLSWACWWLDDGDGAIRAREGAYRLYRQTGDDLGAARVAIWLASDYDDFRGELAIAQGWRQRARRLLEGRPLSAEHGWLAVLEAEMILLIEEDTRAARRCAREAIDAGRQCGNPDTEILGLSILGLARVTEGRVEEGMKDLDEAAAAVLGGELQDEIWANKVLCYLLFACERVRDFGRAAQWCEKMREVADRMRFPFAQGFCRAHYGSLLVSRGAWADAEATLGEAAAFLETSRPPWVAEALVRLADLRRRQGRLDEATELLRRAEWHPAAALGLAEIALDVGRPKEGEELVERFLRHVPRESRLQRAAGLELLVRIAALMGKHERATEALDELRQVSDAVATPPLRGAASFSAAVMAVASGNAEEARACLQDAVALFEQSGTPYEAARARLELAGVLATLGQAERAREEAITARQVLEQLGAAFSLSRARALLNDLERRGARWSRPSDGRDLTPRQIEILSLVSQGRSDREIAAALQVSEHTVHRHMANILTRLDAPTRAAAAAQAASRGLI